MYQALYRKWRPRTFDDVVGQGHVTETLKRQLMTGRLSHAYLFVGTRGTGKTTCAKLLARAINCENPQNGNPCNGCPSCRGIESGAVLDVEELDAASNNGVDNIRALRDEAVFTPAAVKKRVYIVDEVHMLSTPAFNALLKILEEPPEHLVFILATTELQKVPATILSRCQRFSFKRISAEDAAARLKYVAEKENIDLTDGAAALLARLADGSMRDALSLLDQCAGAGSVDEKAVYDAVGLAGALDTAKMLDTLASGDAGAAVEQFDKMYFGGKDPAGVLGELGSLCRDVLLSKVAPKNGGGLMSGAYPPEVISGFAEKLSKQQLIRYLNQLQAAASPMKGGDRRINAEMCLISLAQPEAAEDIEALSARIERLESGAVTITQKSPAPVPEKKPLEDAPPWEEEPVPAPAPVKAEPAPAPRPAPEKKPEPEKPAAEGNSGDIWADILKAAKSALTPSQRMILDSRDNAEGEYENGNLTLRVKNRFAENILNVSSVTTALKAAAEKLTARPCVVKVELGESRTEIPKKTAPAEDKLDRLSKFSNVKFE